MGTKTSMVSCHGCLVVPLSPWRLHLLQYSEVTIYLSNISPFIWRELIITSLLTRYLMECYKFLSIQWRKLIGNYLCNGRYCTSSLHRSQGTFGVSSFSPSDMEVCFLNHRSKVSSFSKSQSGCILC